MSLLRLILIVMLSRQNEYEMILLNREGEMGNVID